MSAITPTTPYAAPWATQFTRYSAQFRTLSGTGAVSRSVTVPAGQWWRPIYLMVQYQTDAVAGSRVMELRIVPSATTNVYVQPASIAQAASCFATYVFGVGVSNVAQTTVTQFEVSVQSIPDLIWPPGAQFFMIMNGTDAGDAWHTDPGLAVEIYAEDYNNPGALLPSTTPVVV